MLLVVALLIGILPTPTAHAAAAVSGETIPVVAPLGEESDETQAVETPEGKVSNIVAGEVPELRDESVKHFRMEDGSFIAVDYGIPVHYLDEDAGWQDIDNTLHPVETGNGNGYATYGIEQSSAVGSDTYAAANGEDEKTFAADLYSGFLFSSQSGSATVMNRRNCSLRFRISVFITGRPRHRFLTRVFPGRPPRMRMAC